MLRSNTGTPVPLGLRTEVAKKPSTRHLIAMRAIPWKNEYPSLVWLPTPDIPIQGRGGQLFCQCKVTRLENMCQCSCLFRVGPGRSNGNQLLPYRYLLQVLISGHREIHRQIGLWETASNTCCWVEMVCRWLPLTSSVLAQRSNL